MAEDEGAGGATIDTGSEEFEAALREAVGAETAELKEALEKERSWRKDDVKKLKTRLNAVPDDFDRERWEELNDAAREAEEQKLRAEQRWDDLRNQLTEEHQAELAKLRTELDQRDTEIHRRVVENELRTALTEAGVRPEYLESVQAMLEKRGPKVVNADGAYRGVFPDELHGDKPIAEYVGEWAATDAAEPFIAASGATGGGAPNGQTGGAGMASIKFEDMSDADKMAFIDEHGLDEYLKLLPTTATA